MLRENSVKSFQITIKQNFLFFNFIKESFYAKFLQIGISSRDFYIYGFEIIAM